MQTKLSTASKHDNEKSSKSLYRLLKYTNLTTFSRDANFRECNISYITVVCSMLVKVKDDLDSMLQPVKCAVGSL